MARKSAATAATAEPEPKGPRVGATLVFHGQRGDSVGTVLAEGPDGLLMAIGAGDGTRVVTATGPSPDDTVGTWSPIPAPPPPRPSADELIASAQARGEPVPVLGMVVSYKRRSGPPDPGRDQPGRITAIHSERCVDIEVVTVQEDTFTRGRHPRGYSAPREVVQVGDHVDIHWGRGGPALSGSGTLDSQRAMVSEVVDHETIRARWNEPEVVTSVGYSTGNAANTWYYPDDPALSPAPTAPEPSAPASSRRCPQVGDDVYLTVYDGQPWQGRLRSVPARVAKVLGPGPRPVLDLDVGATHRLESVAHVDASAAGRPDWAGGWSADRTGNLIFGWEPRPGIHVYYWTSAHHPEPAEVIAVHGDGPNYRLDLDLRVAEPVRGCSFGSGAGSWSWVAPEPAVESLALQGAGVS